MKSATAAAAAIAATDTVLTQDQCLVAPACSESDTTFDGFDGACEVETAPATPTPSAEAAAAAAARDLKAESNSPSARAGADASRIEAASARSPAESARSS